MKDIFVGRGAEVERFRQILDAAGRPPWVVNVWGKGGIGKTKLLERFIEVCDQQVQAGQSLRRTGIVDFYDTTNRRRSGLMRRIVAQLGVDEAFEGFLEILEWDTARTVVPESAEARQAAIETENKFVEEYNQLAAQMPIVLFFDTFEEVQEQETGRWLLNDLLPRLWGHTVAVICGRNQIALAAPKPGEQRGKKRSLEPLQENEVIFVELDTFSLTEAEDFFRALELDQAILDPQAPQILLTLTGGRPLLLALAADWIVEDARRHGGLPTLDLNRLGIPEAQLDTLRRQLGDFVSTLSQTIARLAGPQFEAALMERIIELSEPEHQAILYMAHVYRRFNLDILRHLFDNDLEYDERLIHGLARFSFVKYRPPSDGFEGSCLLHDEMRDLVNRHLWDKYIDPDRTTRRERSQKMLSYYDARIKGEQDPRERQALQSERLFYQLDADLERGYQDFSRWFDEEVVPRHEMGLGELLLGEVGHYWEQLSPQRQDEVLLRKARFYFERQETTTEARQVLTELLERDTEKSETLLAEIEYELGRYDVLDSRFETHAEHLEQARAFYEKTQDYFRLGRVLNYLGYAARLQGWLDTGLEYYEQALAAFEEAEADSIPQQEIDKWIGLLAANLAGVYRLQGRFLEARIHAGRALRIHEGVGNQREMARTLNTLAMAHRDSGDFADAEDAYLRALNALESERVPDRLLIGRILANLGFLYYRKREWGGAVECYLREKLQRLIRGRTDAQEHDLEIARDQLERSRDILLEVGNQKELVSVYNKLGSFWLIWGDWDKSRENTLESQRLAYEVNDHYHVVDCWVDLAALNYFCRDLDAIPRCEQEAKNTLDRHHLYYPYLVGRLETTLGNVAYEAGRHLPDEKTGEVGAFVHYARACQAMADFNRDSYERHLYMLSRRLSGAEGADLGAIYNTLERFWVDEAEMAEEHPDFLEACRVAAGLR